MRIVLTESQYNTLFRRYITWIPLDKLVNLFLVHFDPRSYETFDLFYTKIKEHTTDKIIRDMLTKDMLDTADYVNNESEDLVERIKNNVHSYIDNNLKDKIKNAYERHSKKKSNLDEVELTERCWKGYTQKGMKTMFGKRYPNCVKIKK